MCEVPEYGRNPSSMVLLTTGLVSTAYFGFSFLTLTTLARRAKVGDERSNLTTRVRARLSGRRSPVSTSIR